MTKKRTINVIVTQTHSLGTETPAMTGTAPQLSTDEVRELATHLGVTLRDRELETVRDEIANLLAGANSLSRLPIDRATDRDRARSWHRPTDDEYNAVSAVCDVGPDGREGPLSGTAVGVKDAIAVAGVPMECGSATMQEYAPQTDATIVSRLLDAGATITAKTSLDEFAGSGRGTTRRGPPVRNPHDPERTAGGSSGGSAAAVAEGRVDVAIGTDTGGSVRMPAALCGVVGLKPTYGLVPLSGVVENTYTLDHVGPLTTSAADAAAVLEAISGSDESDPASLMAAGRGSYAVGGYTAAVDAGTDLSSVTFGFLEEGIGPGVRDAVADRTADAVDRLRGAGATVCRVSVDHYEHLRAVKNVLSATEIAAHWRADAAPVRRPGGIDPAYQAAFAARRRTADRPVNAFYKAKLMAGAYLLAEDAGLTYTRAREASGMFRAEFDEALTDVDALLLPTMPDVAPRIGDADDPGFDYARNTRPANVTGLPAITLPNGEIDGLPVGLQLIGHSFGESELLRLADAVEPLLDFPAA